MGGSSMAMTGEEFTKKYNAAAAAYKPPAKPKKNTGASQSVGGVLSSLGRGGQAANWGGLSRSLVNIAGEASGVYDLNRARNEWNKGNKVGAAGRAALGLVGFVPGLGAASKAISGAAKLAKGTRLVTAASKARPVAAVVGSRPGSMVRTALQPVAKANTTLQKVSDFSYTPLYKAKTSAGRFVSPLLTSPAVIAGTIGQTIQGFTAPAPSNVANAGGPQQGPGLDGRDQGLGGTPPAPGTPKAPGAGGGGTTPPPPPGTGPGEPPAPGGGTGSGVNTTTIEGINAASGFKTSDEQTGLLQTGSDQAATGGATPVGVPGGVQVAGADYNAALAANAAQSYARQAGIREALAQGIEGIQGGAADIIGGRSQAILGQGITGQRRAYDTGMAGETQRSISEQEASRQAYTAAVNKAYADQAQAILDAARARSAQVAQIRQIG